MAVVSDLGVLALHRPDSSQRDELRPNADCQF